MTNGDNVTEGMKASKKNKVALNLTDDDSACELCYEMFATGIAEAEMYDPDDSNQSSVMCHVFCGRLREYEIERTFG